MQYLIICYEPMGVKWAAQNLKSLLVTKRAADHSFNDIIIVGKYACLISTTCTSYVVLGMYQLASVTE